MSKKTATKTAKPTSKSSKPASDAAANDKGRADALAKLNAKPTAVSVAATLKAQSTKTSAPRSKRPRDASRKGPSALDAAAQVLQALPAKEAKFGLSTSELIDRMAAAGPWTSPGGKTPAATLYAAMIREIVSKGDASRFRRLDATAGGARGRFAPSSAPASTPRTAPSRKGAA